MHWFHAYLTLEGIALSALVVTLVYLTIRRFQERNREDFEKRDN